MLTAAFSRRLIQIRALPQTLLTDHAVGSRP